MARRADVGAVLAIAPLVTLLGWLSVSSSVAAFRTLSHEDTVAQALIAAPVHPAAARAAADANERAAAWFDAPYYQMRAARALLALPRIERRRAAGRIERLDRASLSDAPMSAYGWTLLAFVRLDRQDVRGAVGAWQMSLLIGRYVPDIMRSRLLLGIELMQYDAGVRSDVTDQIRLLAVADPNGLAEFARAGGIEPLVRGVLAGRPESAAFERATRALVGGSWQRLASGGAKT